MEKVEQNQVQKSILLVEDNQDDVVLIRRAFERAGVELPLTQCVFNGEEAIAYLKGKGPYEDRSKYPVPDLVLLDIKLPGTDGFEVLRWIRQQWGYRELCVVMLTTSDEIRDVNQAYQLGANSFLVKPLDFVNARELAHSLNTVLAGRHSS